MPACYYNSLRLNNLNEDNLILLFKMCLTMFILGYKYAGLQSSTQCHCGNQYNSHGEVQKNKCNLKCSGNSKQKCGGNVQKSIYYTGIGKFPNSCL